MLKKIYNEVYELYVSFFFLDMIMDVASMSIMSMEIVEVIDKI